MSSYVQKYKTIPMRKVGHETLPKYKRVPSPPVQTSMTVRAFYQQHHIRKIKHSENYYDQILVRD